MICPCPKRMEKYRTEFRSLGKKLGKGEVGKDKEMSKVGQSCFMNQLGEGKKKRR